MPFQRFGMRSIKGFAWQEYRLTGSFKNGKQGVVRGFCILVNDQLVLSRDCKETAVKCPVSRARKGQTVSRIIRAQYIFPDNVRRFRFDRFSMQAIRARFAATSKPPDFGL